MNDIKSEVAGQAGHVKVFGEDQYQENDHRENDPLSGEGTGYTLNFCALPGFGNDIALVPVANTAQDQNSDQRDSGEPDYTVLPVWHNDFFLKKRPPPTSTLFPYTTLFR